MVLVSLQAAQILAHVISKPISFAVITPFVFLVQVAAPILKHVTMILWQFVTITAASWPPLFLIVKAIAILILTTMVYAISLKLWDARILPHAIMTSTLQMREFAFTQAISLTVMAIASMTSTITTFAMKLNKPVAPICRPVTIMHQLQLKMVIASTPLPITSTAMEHVC
jgi:hypothetical protein